MASIYGNGTFTGTALSDNFGGRDGNDTISGLDGNDTLHGYTGNDYVYGGNGADFVWGDAGNDFLFGEAGNDKLYGGDGADKLNGGAGADLLNGGTGSDVLTGGSNADTFLFARGDSPTASGGDVITDFKSGVDHIQFQTISGKEVTYQDTAAGIVISYGGFAGMAADHGEIHLTGVHALAYTDFVFT